MAYRPCTKNQTEEESLSEEPPSPFLSSISRPIMYDAFANYRRLDSFSLYRPYMDTVDTGVDEMFNIKTKKLNKFARENILGNMAEIDGEVREAAIIAKKYNPAAFRIFTVYNSQKPIYRRIRTGRNLRKRRRKLRIYVGVRQEDDENSIRKAA